MKICIVSDSHDRAEPLAAAIAKAQANGARAVIHCGDPIGANTLRASLRLGVPLQVVHGNRNPVRAGRIAPYRWTGNCVGSIITP
ncbi:MAG TPA: metallophosphoesterase family protein [Gallionella sp.]|nr:metallophosphoesterase family protein [Gallionella sp.]